MKSVSVLAVVIVLGINCIAGANSFSFSGFASNAGSSIASVIGLSSSSGISSSGISSSRRSTNTDNVRIVNVPFTEAVKDPLLEYKPILDVPMDYDIYLDSSALHWYLVVRGNLPKSNFPYVTFEITTDEYYSSIIPEMRLINPEKEEENLYHSSGIVCSMADYVYRFSGCYMTKKGKVHATMRELSEIAEGVRQNMGNYSLFSKNCQVFCNEFLKKHGLPTTPTTLGFDGLPTTPTTFGFTSGFNEDIMTALMMMAMMKETVPKSNA